MGAELLERVDLPAQPHQRHDRSRGVNAQSLAFEQRAFIDNRDETKRILPVSSSPQRAPGQRGAAAVAADANPIVVDENSAEVAGEGNDDHCDDGEHQWRWRRPQHVEVASAQSKAECIEKYRGTIENQMPGCSCAARMIRAYACVIDK